MPSYSSTASTATITWTREHNATMVGQVIWNGKPVIDDDDGGTAGVREPRRPRPDRPSPAAMHFDDDDLATV